MQKEVEIIVTPQEAYVDELLKQRLAKAARVTPQSISSYRLLRKSVDARRDKIKVHIRALLYIGEFPETQKNNISYPFVGNKEEVLIVGSGPAGLFGALRLIELGYKPVVFERGKEVSERKKDIAQLTRGQEVHPDSNYAFGEGGAGTFSDGKLYTRSRKKGNIPHILQVLHNHGSSDAILYETHPHIGSDKLPGIIKNIRNTILSAGGEFHFDTRISDIHTKAGTFYRMLDQNGTSYKARALLLATGHSAHDVYFMLQKNGIALERKNFAMGVRVEHPQELIDSIQYHSKGKHPYLPSASYNLVTQVDERGVYSFCMCPGGFIVPAATGRNQMVVNGMSASQRNSPFANSGIVVEIREEDIPGFCGSDALSGLKFQQWLEELAFAHGDGKFSAPAQRLMDFVEKRNSVSLPKTSFWPGVYAATLNEWLPINMGDRLRKAFMQFDKKMKGFLTNEAVVLGVESRTSSPVRIPRDPDSWQHVGVYGLFPCGEGAGYAGGIISSALDGEKCAEKIAHYLGSFNL